MKTVGVYSGRFQPPHLGHVDIYKQLKQVTGPDTFIGSSDKVEFPGSPLNFQEKQQIWVRHGVPADNIIRVKNNYKPEEVTDKYDANNTALVVVVGEKDYNRFGQKKTKQGNKEVWLKADNTPGFYQPYKGNENNLRPLKEHGYIWFISNSVRISVGGKQLSGTVAREVLSHPNLTDEQRRKLFQKVFGWFDIGLYEHLVDKFTEARSFSEKPATTPSKITKPIKEESENMFYIDVYNKDGEVFTTIGAKNNLSVTTETNRIFKEHDAGFIPKIVVKDENGKPLKTITYREWLKSGGVAAYAKAKQAYIVKTAKLKASRIAARSGSPLRFSKTADQIKEVINQIITELMPPASAIPQSSDVSAVGTDTTPVGAAERAKAVALARQNAMKAKQQAERDLKAITKDKEFKEKDLISLKKDKIPDKRKEIDALNKQAASGGEDTSSATLTESWLEDFKTKLREAKRI